MRGFALADLVLTVSAVRRAKAFLFGNCLAKLMGPESDDLTLNGSAFLPVKIAGL